MVFCFKITDRLHKPLIFQDQPSLCSTFFLRFAPGGKTDVEGMHDQPELWVTQLREYSLQIVERRKSSLPVSLSQEVFMIGKNLKAFLLWCELRGCLNNTFNYGVEGKTEKESECHGRKDGYKIQRIAQTWNLRNKILIKVDPDSSYPNSP